MGKSDSQQAPKKLLLGSQQTQPGCNLVTLFGELFWRNHLVNSQQTPRGIPVDSKWIPSGLPANSKWIPADSQRTPGEIPSNSRRTSNGHPPDFQQISSKADSGLNLKSLFGELFGEPILRAAGIPRGNQTAHAHPTKS